MKKVLFILIIGLTSITGYSQIVADHTAVAAFDNIPSKWIDEVKKMQLGYIGESHSVGVRTGLQLVEDDDPTYAVNIGQTPDSYTTEYLAVFGAIFRGGSWVGLGEDEWYKAGNAISLTKAAITYTNESAETAPMDVFGLGWCWDPAETAAEMPAYVEATKEYIAYCTAKNYITKVIFTTGPVDDSNASGETGWNKHLAYEVIRDSVANDKSRVLFDYADILCYDDNSETPTTATWNGHTYPVITTTNLGDGSVAHIGSAGALRLGKAMWWMLARIAGWDGGDVDPTSNKDLALKSDPTVLNLIDNELKIQIKDDSNLPDQINLYNIQGSLVSHRDNPGSTSSFNVSGLPAGIYLVKISGSGFNKTQKIFLQ